MKDSSNAESDTPPRGIADAARPKILPPDPAAAGPTAAALPRGTRFQIIEGAYLRDILEQPEALLRARSHLHESDALSQLAHDLAKGRFRRVVLTGMGSSLHALYPLHLALNRHGLVSVWTETAELLIGFDSLYQRDTLLIVVSQSGQSAEVVRLLERADAFGGVLAVTNNRGSRLGCAADACLLLHAGDESTVACKTYVTSLAVLHWLAACLCGSSRDDALREIDATAHAAERYLACWRQHVEDWTALTHDVQCLFVTGRGASLATAGTAGLILKESTRRPAEGMSSAAFRHGPLEMIGPRVLVAVLAGDPGVSPLNQRLYEDILKANGRAVWLAPHAAGPGALQLPEAGPSLLPIIEILPLQMLSLTLAAWDGREAGRFEKASKVTVRE